MASPYTPTVFINGIKSGSEEAILPVITWDVGLSSFVDSTTDLPISGGGGGSGTVTSVSVTTANGVSGSVATATTTPAITLALGAITPSSVAASGTITGSNLSGTNTGNQTNITGNAATVTTNANLTGTITSVGNTTSNTITNPNIVGTITNDNASAGSIGEYIESIISSGSSVSLTSNTPANITSISLTAGDWDVEGAAGFVSTNATTSETIFSCSISLTSATSDTNYFAKSIHSAVVPGNGVLADTLNLARRRISIAATTTVYLIGTSTFSISTGGGYGRLNARRVR